MALDANLILRLRRKIGDIDSTNYSYTDAVLTGYLLDSVGPINEETDSSFAVNYTAETISPAPGADDAYAELYALWAAVDLIGGNTANSAKNAIKIKDGDTAIDLTASLGSKSTLYNQLWAKLIALLKGIKEDAAFGDAFATGAPQVVETAEDWAEAMYGNIPSSDFDVDTII